MSAGTILLLAVVGTMAIFLGSAIAMAAPTDGQTGMVAFPLWLLGAILGLIALAACFGIHATPSVRWSVAFLAVASLASVALSFWVCARATP